MRQLANWLEAYQQYTHRIEPPAVFNLWSGLWALSAAIGRKAWLDFGHFQIYPNLFVVLTGPPASRKTTSAVIANRLVDEVESIQQGPDMTSKEALLDFMGKNGSDFHWRGEDTYHCSTSIISTEWSTFMGSKDTELCNVMCKLYDCDSKFNKWTKTQGSDKLRNVYLSLLGCSTARQIGDCLPHAAIGGGFTSRIIFVVEDEDKAKRNPRPSLDKKEKDLRKLLVQDLEEIAHDIVGEFKFTEGGGLFFDDWYMYRDEPLRIDDKFHHYCDRKPVHVKTLSMLLSAARRTDMKIGAGEVAEAIGMLNAIEPRMPEALGGVGLSMSSPVIAAILRLMRVYKVMSRRQLQTFLYRDANFEELGAALQTITSMDVGVVAGEGDEYHWIGG